MTRSPLRRRLGALAAAGVLAAVVLAACSSDDPEASDGSTTTTRETRPGETTTTLPGTEGAWFPEQRAQALEIGAELSKAGSECAPDAYFREEYLASFLVLDWPIPYYAGSCTWRGEDVEILVFPDADEAQGYLDARVERLCGADAGLPGYPWARLDAAVLTPDTEEGADRIAEALDGDGGWVDCEAEQG